jgi:hypothetical protein
MRPVRIIATLLFAAAIWTPTLLGRTCMGRVPATARRRPVSPTPVLAGHTVTLSGSVGREAAGSDCSNIILYSDGFAPTNRVGDMTAVYGTATPSGAFRQRPRSPFQAGRELTIYLRCGGATLGGGTLVVRAAPTTQPPNSVSAPAWSSPGAPSPCRVGRPPGVSCRLGVCNWRQAAIQGVRVHPGVR